MLDEAEKQVPGMGGNGRPRPVCPGSLVVMLAGDISV